ncbi:MAG: hypothetical protein M3Q10_09930 [Chloroflexota bacterium]|nr:hypothetical protein [Chloroflexota bacterium]
MNRLSVFLGAMLVLGVAAPAAVFAQEATPATEEAAPALPPGVAIVPVDELAPLELPVEPSALAVYRLEMEPRSAIPTHPHPGLEVVVVEAGSSSFLDESGPALRVIRAGGGEPEQAGPGEELTAQAGDTAIFPAGNYSDTRAGEDGATLLIFEIVPEQNTFEP